jgi:hypothetical protein
MIVLPVSGKAEPPPRSNGVIGPLAPYYIAQMSELTTPVAGVWIVEF